MEFLTIASITLKLGGMRDAACASLVESVIQQGVMLIGDHRKTADAIAQEVGIQQVVAEVRNVLSLWGTLPFVSLYAQKNFCAQTILCWISA